MLTDKYLLIEKPHPFPMVGGVQRIYRFPSGFGLSVVNGKMLHAYSFAWEVAVLKNVSADGKEFELTYDTPLTNDVEVFQDDKATNEFVEKAIELLAKPQTAGKTEAPQEVPK